VGTRHKRFSPQSEVAGVIARYAKFVRVSLDSGTPETHHFAHGLPEGQYQYLQILDNMRALREKSDAAHRKIDSLLALPSA
jgi:hypothetical protein